MLGMFFKGLCVIHLNLRAELCDFLEVEYMTTKYVVH